MFCAICFSKLVGKYSVALANSSSTLKVDLRKKLTPESILGSNPQGRKSFKNLGWGGETKVKGSSRGTWNVGSSSGIFPSARSVNTLPVWETSFLT